MVAVAVQFRSVSSAIRYVAYFLSLAVVVFLFALSIVEDVVGDIRLICENVRIHYQSQYIRKQFSDTIEFSDKKGYCVLFQIHPRWIAKYLNSLFLESIFRLVRNAIRIFRITLIVLFLGCTGAICLAMLMIQLELVQVIFHCIDAFWTLKW